MTDHFCSPKELGWQGNLLVEQRTKKSYSRKWCFRKSHKWNKDVERDCWTWQFVTSFVNASLIRTWKLGTWLLWLPGSGWTCLSLFLQSGVGKTASRCQVWHQHHTNAAPACWVYEAECTRPYGSTRTFNCMKQILLSSYVNLTLQESCRWELLRWKKMQ